MKKNFIAIGILSIALLFAACTEQADKPATEATSFTVDELVEQAKANITEVSIVDFKKLYDEGEYYLIDVRDKGEFKGAYIPGAINISRGLVEFKMEKAKFWEDEGHYPPLKENLIVVYCKKGSRAALAAEAIQKMGFTNVLSIKGGFKAWKEKNPSQVEKSAATGGHGTPAEEEGGC